MTFPTGLTPPWNAAVNTGGFLLNEIAADPSASDIFYVSGAQTYGSSPPGGAWRIIAVLGTTGNVDVAPANGNHVAIGAGNHLRLDERAGRHGRGRDRRRVHEHHRQPTGPQRSPAVFDPVDPNLIYAVLDGFSDDPGSGQNVFWTTVGSGSWTDISPPLDLPCGAIAVDGTTTPTTLYVGTDYGVLRSTDRGASWSILDEIHFPRRPCSTWRSTRRPCCGRPPTAAACSSSRRPPARRSRWGSRTG